MKSEVRLGTENTQAKITKVNPQETVQVQVSHELPTWNTSGSPFIRYVRLNNIK